MTRPLSARSVQDAAGLIAAAVGFGALYLAALVSIHKLAGLDFFNAPAHAPTAAETYEQAVIETSRGGVTSLAGTNGRVRLATMFYAHCPGMCPLTVNTLQSIERQLTAQQREKLTVLLLTLDPARDSLATLREFELQRRIDSDHWIVGRTATAVVGKIAAAIGVTYRTFDDGTVDHSNAIVLLDTSGHVLARSTGTQSADPRFIAAVRAALDAS